MKRFITIVFFTAISFFIFNNQLFSQENDENSVKTVLNNIMELSKTKSYDKLAALLLYTGNDKTRALKSNYDPKIKEELAEVQRIGKKIAALIRLSDSYRIAKVKAAKLQNMDGYEVTVDFKSGSQTLPTIFQFIKLPQGYALFDID